MRRTWTQTRACIGDPTPRRSNLSRDCPEPPRNEHKRNDDHRHTGLGLHTPADVHYGLAEAIRDKRAGVLDAAYAAHPERFVRKPPEPPRITETSWINRPDKPEEDAQ